MNWEKSISLKSYNTFGIDATCDEFITISSMNQLKQLCVSQLNQILILGGGSNVLLPDKVTIPVLKNDLKGISILYEDVDTVQLEIMSGEIWHELVEWTVKRNYGGIENLALIPGTVGAAPIQNIGAYGTELKDVLKSVEVMSLASGEISSLMNESCHFGYRDSIFKNEFKGQHFITSIIIELTKRNHILNVGYGAIKKELERNNIVIPTIGNLFDVVVAIRKSKLPDPLKLGNSGSFFKNIELEKKALLQLEQKIGEVMKFTLENGNYKVPTGWLLEKFGWKGKTIGNVGCYEKQALIIVNKGKATGSEIKDFAFSIIDDIYLKTGIRISPEVNFIS